MSAMLSQITSLTIVISTVYSGTDQRKPQSSMSLAFVWGIHQWLVNPPHKEPVTWKMLMTSSWMLRFHEDLFVECDAQFDRIDIIWPRSAIEILIDHKTFDLYFEIT